MIVVFEFHLVLRLLWDALRINFTYIGVGKLEEKNVFFFYFGINVMVIVNFHSQIAIILKYMSNVGKSP
jgi:hypothetical protein